MASDVGEGNILVWPFNKIKELEQLNQIHRSEIDSLALQLEERSGQVSILERWLSDVKREKEELKETLYKVTGIIKERTNNQTVFEKLPTGPVRMSTVLKHLEHQSKIKTTPISKDSIDEIEREVGLNASS